MLPQGAPVAPVAKFGLTVAAMTVPALTYPAGLPVLAAAAVRSLEQELARQDGIPTGTLMARAGAAAFACLRQHWPNARRIAVVCGRGNNAGDGYVLARLAHDAGLTVQVLQLPGELHSEGDAADALATLPVKPLPFAPAALIDCEVIVDALFGIGLHGKPNAAAATVIAAINASHKPVLALDLPSGLEADTGNGASVAVHASVTACFIALKPGLVTGRAVETVGQLELCQLDLPAARLKPAQPGEWLALADLRRELPVRRRASHKGEQGHVLVVGGSPGFGGAARLAGEAALRTGAGLVSVYCHQDYVGGLVAARPELMVRGFAPVPDLHDMAALTHRADVVVVGPGLGTASWAMPVLDALLHCGKPLVIDADGLNLLAMRPPTQAMTPAILTPHPGEAARLLGITVPEVEADRFTAARTLQRQFGGVVVLKGAGTIVTDGERFSVIRGGNPGMASGGMGDVLAGLIAALRGQGWQNFDAARLGAALHAWAADQAVASRGGERGLLASDLLAHVSAGLQPG